jgi:hypothetical protein
MTNEYQMTDEEIEEGRMKLADFLERPQKRSIARYHIPDIAFDHTEWNDLMEAAKKFCELETNEAESWYLQKHLCETIATFSKPHIFKQLIACVDWWNQYSINHSSSAK